MRWKELRVGDTRIKHGFLFLPKHMNGEWRWLEFATWEQVVRVVLVTPVGYRLAWRNDTWIDNR